MCALGWPDFKCRSNVKRMCKVEKGPKPRAVRKRKQKPAKKKYKCPECDYWGIAPSHVAIHMVTHTGERKFSCNIGDCKKKFGRKGDLATHQMTHLGKLNPRKKHKCEKCDFLAFSSSNLAQHMFTHDGRKPFACDFGACEKRFAHKGNLTRHKNTHFNIRPYACNQCGYRSAAKADLAEHERIHSKDLFLSCDLCEYTSNSDANLVRHRKRHMGIKNHVCNFGGWCESRFVTSTELKKHEKTHTIEGQIRRKVQENRVNELLKKWGYTSDLEITINAKMTNCLTDTDRYFSRIDFVVVNCVNAILILECDEEAHASYTLSCEFSRMADVQASLTKAGFTAPVYWIRYAPTGKYHVNGEQVKMHRPKREAELKKHLKTLCSPEFQPKNQVNIHYLFYDLESTASGPSIMLDNDFPAVMKPFVSWWCP